MPNEKMVIYKKISIKDFDDKFDKIDNIDDKFKFLYSYILSHKVDKNNKESLRELILHAKNKFSEALNKLKKDTNSIKIEKIETKENASFNYVDNYDIEIMKKDFVKNPIKFIRSLALALPLNNFLRDDIGNGAVEDDGEEEYYDMEKWKINCNNMVDYLKSIEKYYEKYDTASLVEDINKSIGDIVYKDETKTIDYILNDTKGGFFENLFHRTSNEFKLFKETFKDFSIKGSQSYGNKDNLVSAARMYLHHKIPSFKNNDKYPKKEDVEKLSGTAKKRVELCIGVLKSVNKANEIEEFVKSLKNENDVDKQNEFRENLTNMLEDNLSNTSNKDFIDNNEINNENDISFESNKNGD